MTIEILPVTDIYRAFTDCHCPSIYASRKFDRNKINKTMNNNNKSHKNVWLGIVLVTIGAYYLLRNFNLIPYFVAHYLTSWEVIFVLIGGSMLATGRRTGLIFLLIGGISLVPQIFYWPQIHLRDLWPLILIAIGFYVIIRRKIKTLQRYKE
jgi:cadmium resistance protein CadD (predicted permease)